MVASDLLLSKTQFLKSLINLYPFGVPGSTIFIGWVIYKGKLININYMNNKQLPIIMYPLVFNFYHRAWINISRPKLIL